MPRRYEKSMQVLQDLYTQRERKYTKQRENHKGIRSSQIAAIVDFLIEIGVINFENLYLEDILNEDK